MWLENKSIKPMEILPAVDNPVDTCLTIESLKDGKNTSKTGVNEQ
jgi:hypothetical protein